MAAKGRVVISLDFCKGCELCIEACPQNVLGINEEQLSAKGYHPAHMIGDGCTGCAVCALVCPEAAITVFRQKQNKPEDKK